MPSGENPGLYYLMKYRQPAMQNYLKFLGGSAKSLEPKTKFLMYVMLETILFSPRGLKHYIQKAHKNGCTIDEILDAILVGYPAAGLAKVVDAVLILEGLEIGEPTPTPTPATVE